MSLCWYRELCRCEELFILLVSSLSDEILLPPRLGTLGVKPRISLAEAGLGPLSV